MSVKASILQGLLMLTLQKNRIWYAEEVSQN